MRTILKTVKDRGLTIKNGGGGNIFINKEIYMEYQDFEKEYKKRKKIEELARKAHTVAGLN